VSEYIDATGRRLKSHDMTRDGFTLLAMGFTGPRAMLWKVMYIEAFNIMAAMLQGSSPGETVQTHIRQLRFLESYFPESQ
jgi:Rha family phage regulatory protein